MAEENNNTVQYTDDNIRHLSDMEHVRTRPGMYIGRLGDGNLPEDGIYVLLKEVVDNSIDEFKKSTSRTIFVSACAIMAEAFRRASLSRLSACSILVASTTARPSRRVWA